jgi:hypothetical protein
MSRLSEFVAFGFEDLEFMPKGSEAILIRRSKTDEVGKGARVRGQPI